MIRPPKILVLTGLFGLLILCAVPCKAQSATGIKSLRSLASERAVIREKATTSVAAKESQTIRYSGSAQAGNMVVPAILLGLPTIVILALIIRAMKGGVKLFGLLFFELLYLSQSLFVQFHEGAVVRKMNITAHRMFAHFRFTMVGEIGVVRFYILSFFLFIAHESFGNTSESEMP